LGSQGSHGFLWQNGKMTALVSLSGFPGAGAACINASGQIVGSVSQPNVGHAALWEQGKIYDLNGALPAGSGWWLTSASGINDSGRIVGSGMLHGQSHAYLLTPQ